MFEAFCPLQVTGAPVMQPLQLAERHQAAGEGEEAEEDLEPERRHGEAVDASAPAVVILGDADQGRRQAAEACESAIRSGILVIGIQIDIACADQRADDQAGRSSCR